MKFYEVLVDGTPWVAADDSDAWALPEAQEMAAHVERLGYKDVEIVPL